MLKIVFDLSDFEEVEIVPISDVHIGNPLCAIDELKNIIEYINEEPADPKRARICLLNGDLTESVTRKSVGNIFDMTMTPQIQVATMIEMLKPLTEPREHYPQGKILCYAGGNHDVDRYKDTGITSAESIAVGLGLEDRYSPDGCYSFIKLNRMHDLKERNITATIYNTHLSGGGQSVGARANKIQRVSMGILADLYVGSHFHNPTTYKEDIIVPAVQSSSLTQKTMTYLITGAFLRYGDYAQRMGMKPSTITIPKVFITQIRADHRDKQKRYIKVEVLL